MRDHLAYPDGGIEPAGDEIQRTVVQRDVHDDARMRPHEVRKHGGKEEACRKADGVDADGPHHIPNLRAGRLEGMIQVDHGGPDRLQEHRSGFGRRDAARGTVEELYPQAILERTHRLAQGGRRHAQESGCTAEAPRIRNGGEGAQRSEICGSDHSALSVSSA